MTEILKKRCAASPCARPGQSSALKDEVYRHMFRLEAHRPGAALDLAVALLRASMAFDSGSNVDIDKQWLNKILPICLSMIESTAQAGQPVLPDNS